jgi:hypothetical protein
VASSACFGCGLTAFGVGGVACSVCFDSGRLTGGVGIDGAASADGVEAGGGIVMLGFFAAGACREDGADCAAAAGGSRRTGVSGPAAGGVSAPVAGSAAGALGGAASIAAEINRSRTAVRSQRISQLLRVAWWGIATPVLGCL